MTEDIRYIGVHDQVLDLFESQYPVPEGITYNSYLIIDEKIAVIDTVDERMAGEWQANLEKALPNGRTPDYLIVQHLEPDHSGCIGWVMERFPECRLLCTAPARRMLPLVTRQVTFDDRIDEVADGATLSLGKHQLTFLTAPMVHWPEVMMVYDATSATLFSADAFGRFGDADATKPWACEARRYYFNIVGKYGRQVQILLAKLEGRKIERIAPLHGPVIDCDLSEYLQLYTTWASYGVETPGVLVAHASIHGFTAKAAAEMAEILKAMGAPKVVVCDLTRDEQTEAVEDAFRMGHLVLMSSTYDAHLFPPMYDFLHHLRLKGFCNRRVGLVENGLWAPAAARVMRGMLEEMKNIDIVEPVVTLRGRHTADNLDQMRLLAAALLEK